MVPPVAQLTLLTQTRARVDKDLWWRLSAANLLRLLSREATTFTRARSRRLAWRDKRCAQGHASAWMLSAKSASSGSGDPPDRIRWGATVQPTSDGMAAGC